jgi:hypothetical protein
MHANLNVFVNVLTYCYFLFSQIEIILAFFTPLRFLDTVYRTLMRVLHEYKVPISGICSDGASTMQGVHKGVCTQLTLHICVARGLLVEEPRGQEAESRGRATDTFHPARGLLLVRCALCVCFVCFA